MTLLPPTPLRRERQRAGLSQLALAVRARCSLSTISLAERGMPLSPRIAERIAAALGVSPDALTSQVPRSAEASGSGDPHAAATTH